MARLHGMVIADAVQTSIGRNKKNHFSLLFFHLYAADDMRPHNKMNKNNLTI